MCTERVNSQEHWHRPLVPAPPEAEVKGLQWKFYPGKFSTK